MVNFNGQLLTTRFNVVAAKKWSSAAGSIPPKVTLSNPRFVTFRLPFRDTLLLGSSTFLTTYESSWMKCIGRWTLIRGACRWWGQEHWSTC